MGVKKLEWENNNYVFVCSDSVIGFYNIDVSNIYTPTEYTIYIKGQHLNLNVANRYKTLNEAKQACQDHYEKFILSQVENDHIIVEHDIAKPFDPLLIGFEYTGVDSREGKEYLLWFDDEKTILSGKIYHNQTYNTWLINFDNLYIESIEIPNHYFGTQLISQF